MAAAPESTPNEGARQIAKHIAPVSADSESRATYAQLQTSLESIRSAGVCTLSTTPWPKVSLSCPGNGAYQDLAGADHTHGLPQQHRT